MGRQVMVLEGIIELMHIITSRIYKEVHSTADLEAKCDIFGGVSSRNLRYKVRSILKKKKTVMTNFLWILLLLPLCHGVDLSQSDLVHVPADIARNETEVLLSHNLITTIEAGAFSGFDALELIDLSFNTLTSIDNDAFVNSSINKIVISTNQITEFPYFYQDTLRELHAAHNGFQDFDLFRFLERVSKIDTLALQYNKIKRLHGNRGSESALLVDPIKRQSALEHLHISDNGIDFLEPGIFSGFKKLSFLVLAGNGLNVSVRCEEINDTTIRNFKLNRNRITLFPDLSCIAHTLTHLDLKSNMISTLNPTSIEKLTQLQTLNLSNNAIMQVTGLPAWTQTSSLSLKLSGNPLKCDCRWEWLFSPVWREIRKRMVPTDEVACLGGPLALTSVPWANLTFSQMCSCE
ncbi:hypothetical protein CAPTEDRAFT_186357 [Capitella teleta]|uniref:LRRCT domain-containing protein n=1 Tax=Capitella teleta TaxID=283909 RepID=R7TS03_CAPTE|nr:hypothetical protein CAPTEDRAFT_186357 [Capitella teleta]|eukprot:ELT96708.1 hypothetical protein CAPTEDRAFT_186357 [Capitella teleta]